MDLIICSSCGNKALSWDKNTSLSPIRIDTVSLEIETCSVCLSCGTRFREIFVLKSQEEIKETKDD